MAIGKVLLLLSSIEGSGTLSVIIYLCSKDIGSHYNAGEQVYTFCMQYAVSVAHTRSTQWELVVNIIYLD